MTDFGETCGVRRMMSMDRVAAEKLERDLLCAFSYHRRSDLLAALRAHPDGDGCCDPWCGRIIGLVTGNWYLGQIDEALAALGVDPLTIEPCYWSWALVGAWLASRERSGAA